MTSGKGGAPLDVPSKRVKPKWGKQAVQTSVVVRARLVLLVAARGTLAPGLEARALVGAARALAVAAQHALAAHCRLHRHGRAKRDLPHLAPAIQRTLQAMHLSSRVLDWVDVAPGVEAVDRATRARQAVHDLLSARLAPLDLLDDDKRRVGGVDLGTIDVIHGDLHDGPDRNLLDTCCRLGPLAHQVRLLLLRCGSPVAQPLPARRHHLHRR